MAQSPKTPLDPRHDLADRIVPVHEAQLANGGLEGSLTKLVLFWDEIVTAE